MGIKEVYPHRLSLRDRAIAAHVVTFTDARIILSVREFADGSAFAYGINLAGVVASGKSPREAALNGKRAASIQEKYLVRLGKPMWETSESPTDEEIETLLGAVYMAHPQLESHHDYIL